MKRDPFATEGSTDPGEQYIDEKTEKKIEKHLTDETDEITEQDIADAPAGPVNKKGETIPVDIPGSKKEELKEEEDKKEEDKVKENTDPGIETAWNVLES